MTFEVTCDEAQSDLFTSSGLRRCGRPDGRTPICYAGPASQASIDAVPLGTGFEASIYPIPLAATGETRV
ncbi:hypothetical protein QO014_000859 [Kaistia dalseonensis]|uniref:Uncharacterized protein n=1 Tax=Kaistia dalseonensis TaxID=410840 RepID=A0ABU0H2F5_9HYPH|nr:hypothetical protein [Kaistia dalseonensis]